LNRVGSLATNEPSHSTEERFATASDIASNFFRSLGKNVNHISAELTKGFWCWPSKFPTLAWRLGQSLFLFKESLHTFGLAERLELHCSLQITLELFTQHRLGVSSPFR
jgi:hypothetical protein